MQAELERLSALERRLSVRLPASEIATEVETRLKRLSRTVRLHGFRPGKVPLKVVAQQFGPQVRQEVLGDAMQRSFGEAVRQQNLRVAGYPRFEPKPLGEGETEFEYSAVFEVYPDVVVGDLGSVHIERPVLAVGEAEVDKTIEVIRKQRARYEPVERAAREGDRVILDYRGTIGGAEFPGGSASGQSVTIGERRLLPEFEEHLVGAKPGETRTFEVCFPEDYRNAELAGKTARFEVSVKEVAEPRLPPLDAEFAKSLGVADGDLARMRAEVKENLEREVRARLKQRVKDQVMQKLLEVTAVEAPRSLVEIEVQRLRSAMRQDLAARGVQVAADAQLPSELFRAQAERRVKLGLILAELVRTHALQAKPEQVRAAVEEQAQSYERPEEVVKWFYGSPERLREVESMVLEDNVVAWALSVARVTEKAIEFDELMGNR
jgi:trigger factor